MRGRLLAAVGGIVMAGLVACDRGGELQSTSASTPVGDVIEADFALVDVSIVPMTSERVIEGRNVLVDNGTHVAHERDSRWLARGELDAMLETVAKSHADSAD